MMMNTVENNTNIATGTIIANNIRVASVSSIIKNLYVTLHLTPHLVYPMIVVSFPPKGKVFDFIIIVSSYKIGFPFTMDILKYS